MVVVGGYTGKMKRGWSKRERGKRGEGDREVGRGVGEEEAADL